MAALWGAVIFSGIYHGFNPAMGWPLAVSAALFERKKSALFKATIALGIGHLLSMLIMCSVLRMVQGMGCMTWDANHAGVPRLNPTIIGTVAKATVGQITCSMWKMGIYPYLWDMT